MARRNVREQILDAALKSFYEKGFNGTSVQDITVAAGVPKGSFYNHFESKEVLGAQIVDLYDASNVLIPILSDPSLPPVERLRKYFDALGEVMRSRVGGCLLVNFSAEMSDQSSLMRERLNAMWNRWTQAVEVAIHHGQADGTIPADIAANTLATVLFDAFEGAVLRMRAEKSSRPFTHFMTIAFEKILR